jgi:hypothetical protein
MRKPTRRRSLMAHQVHKALVSTSDGEPSAGSIWRRSTCFFIIKRRLKMAVRAEDIVQNSEVSGRVTGLAEVGGAS